MNSKNKKITILLIVIVCLPLLFFLLWLINAKNAPQLDKAEVDQIVEQIVSVQNDQEEVDTIDIESGNVLIIPKMGLREEILGGGPEALESGMWHRSQGVGDPVVGGNFILTGHRFTMGVNSEGLWNSSPLLNIERLEKGDQITVVWEGIRYDYIVDDVFTVAPTQTEIEQQSRINFLTLYTCTLGGESDGRHVIRATPAD